MKGGDVVVLDASALLASVNGEPGCAEVDAALTLGAVVSAVNLAEVLTKLDPSLWPSVLRVWRRAKLKVLPFQESDAEPTAMLPRNVGLSLGDRACLALAMRLGAEAWTADRAWSNVEKVGPRVAAVVHQIR